MNQKAEALTLTPDEPATEARNKTVQVDPELYEKIAALAHEAERTVSKQANRILRQALNSDVTGD